MTPKTQGACLVLRNEAYRVTYKRPRPSGPAPVSRCEWVGAERGEAGGRGG
jgi:hypothetical protein